MARHSLDRPPHPRQLWRRWHRWLWRHLPLVVLLTMLTALALADGAYVRWGDDVSPDSAVGLVSATAGTALLLAGWIGYVLRRTLALRGRLQTWQAWHMVAGVLALGLILMHAAGNTNARTGSYALAATLALAFSGGVGRLVDRYAIRALARLPLGDAAERKALGVELVRVWRRLHLLLAGAALGLIAWHITVAAGLIGLLWWGR